MARRLTITMDKGLENGIRDAPRLLGLPRTSSASERLRELARFGYQAALERELDEKRLETYDRWKDDPEMGVFPKAAFRAAAARGLFRDE